MQYPPDIFSYLEDKPAGLPTSFKPKEATAMAWACSKWQLQFLSLHERIPEYQNADSAGVSHCVLCRQLHAIYIKTLSVDSDRVGNPALPKGHLSGRQRECHAHELGL